MDFLNWLQALGKDADAATKGFQASLTYVVMSVLLPVSVGLLVRFGLRTIEQVLGVELGKGARH